MLRCLSMLGLFCCLVLYSAAQQKLSDEARILALESKWTDAYRLRNVNSMSPLLAEDFVITVEDGRTFGKMGYISHTFDSSVHVELAQESDLKVHLHGNVAVVTGAYREMGTAKGKRYEYHDRLTDIWMKIDGQWQLIASQYSVPLS